MHLMQQACEFLREPLFNITLLNYGGERRLWHRHSGFRSASICSGVRCTHHGPCGLACTPSRRPRVHHTVIVEALTRSNSAAFCAL